MSLHSIPFAAGYARCGGRRCDRIPGIISLLPLFCSSSPTVSFSSSPARSSPRNNSIMQHRRPTVTLPPLHSPISIPCFVPHHLYRMVSIPPDMITRFVRRHDPPHNSSIYIHPSEPSPSHRSPAGERFGILRQAIPLYRTTHMPLYRRHGNRCCGRRSHPGAG